MFQFISGKPGYRDKLFKIISGKPGYSARGSRLSPMYQDTVLQVPDYLMYTRIQFYRFQIISVAHQPISLKTYFLNMFLRYDKDVRNLNIDYKMTCEMIAGRLLS